MPVEGREELGVVDFRVEDVENCESLKLVVRSVENNEAAIFLSLHLKSVFKIDWTLLS